MRVRTRLEKLLRITTLGLPAVVVVVAAACGGETTPPPATPEPPPAATPAPAPEETAAPEAPPPEPTAKPEAEPPPPPKDAEERPPVLMSSEKELQSIFTTSPGAKLELGDDAGRAVFRIREGSLGSAHIITFKIDPKGKSTGVPIGKIYRMLVQIENSAETPTLETLDKPFEFSFPAGNKKDANLAIGELKVDDKGREKITWTIYAPEKIDDAMGVAHFKIKSIGNFYMHVTAKPPTEAPK
ncbi:hypothetical protein [Polyangium spumosum]|uniref:DUF4352 domain-containing protein n=1 Tax=Polyangium spumosum TaxID=889282 RepID=A0A6N7PZ45_9BACT|nr:hypothetical protein [Polyangium spumosum]MRG97368.1 hypothetical protein [Polyangium spumosum]